MARVVSLMGPGGQLKAERELGWDRKTIIKGRREIESGVTCVDNFSGRGRKSCLEHFPNLKEDITRIVNPLCQTDPTFRTQNLYSPISANEVYRRLVEDKGYDPENMPTVRTLSTIMNKLGFKLKKVAKVKVKKIPETDIIFEYVHRTNQLADETEGILRISMDAKATIKVGPYSRGGYSRCNLKAADHDFKPDSILKLFGINIPALDENYMYFTESNITADFMIDALESLWPSLKGRFAPHTLVINLDNGPENSSRRSQFISRLVDFAKSAFVNISLVYYPPYHSKYNPIERIWGVLENHWKGQLLDKIEKVLGLCRTMTWKGENPVVKLIKGVYPKGVRLAKSVMNNLEAKLFGYQGLENGLLISPVTRNDLWILILLNP